jgi:hypothetical protein
MSKPELSLKVLGKLASSEENKPNIEIKIITDNRLTAMLASFTIFVLSQII